MSNPNCDLIIKWSGKEYPINDLSERDTVADLKKNIYSKTGVLPHRQKLMGLLHKGKPAGDEVQLCALKLKQKAKVMMIGSLEEKIAEAIAQPDDMPDVVNDFDIGDEEDVAIENRGEFLAKVEKRIRDYEVKVINQPRVGKKLLVLDIDYTLFDHRSIAESAGELMRPYLHEFLTTAYEDYDIAIWSATSMKWIEVKMRQLGVSTNPNYQIIFHLDSACMISVHTNTYGLVNVKPLGLIWGKFPQFHSGNTIMFDDIRRNFLMNPQNGLKIRPFKDSHQNRHKDRELLKLANYLKIISKLADLSSLNHKHWERYVRDHSEDQPPF